jgi:hypothetical protein
MGSTIPTVVAHHAGKRVVTDDARREVGTVWLQPDDGAPPAVVQHEDHLGGGEERRVPCAPGQESHLVVGLAVIRLEGQRTVERAVPGGRVAAIAFDRYAYEPPAAASARAPDGAQERQGEDRCA